MSELNLRKEGYNWQKDSEIYCCMSVWLKAASQRSGWRLTSLKTWLQLEGSEAVG